MGTIGQRNYSTSSITKTKNRRPGSHLVRVSLEEIDEALAVCGGVDAGDLRSVVGERLEECLSVFPCVVFLLLRSGK